MWIHVGDTRRAQVGSIEPFFGYKNFSVRELRPSDRIRMQGSAVRLHVDAKNTLALYTVHHLLCLVKGMEINKQRRTLNSRFATAHS